MLGVEADGAYVAARLADLRRSVLWSIARAVLLLRRTTRAVRARVRKDRLAYLTQLQDNISLHDLKDPRRLYRAVRRAFPSAQAARRSRFTPLPQVKLADGSFAQSACQRMMRWHEHFSELESGETIAAEDYSALFARQSLCTPRDRPVFQIEAVPSLAAMEAVTLGLKAGKACGLDGVTAELLQLDSVRTTRALFPIALKSVLAVREPTAFRGGHLAILAKKALAAVDCQDFRAILLSSVPGKIQHRLLRQNLAPFLSRTKQDLQCGVLPGIGTEALLLFARSLQGHSRASNRRAAFLFFDVRAAFYRLVRQLVAPLAEDERDFWQMLASLCLPEGALQELVQHLQHMAAIPASGVGSHATALASDLFRGTWFRLDKGVALSLTRRGSRPGDPTADLLYGFCLSALHAAMDRTLAARGLLPDVPVPAAPPLLQQALFKKGLGAASWARHVAGVDLPAVLQLCSLTLQVCFERATAMGVQFSQGPAKTAVMISDPPRGQRIQGVVPTTPEHICVANDLLGTHEAVVLVSAYKYLGGVITSDECPRTEVQHRQALAAGVARPLRRRLFSNRGIDVSVRRTLLRALSVSKYVYGSTALILSTGVHARQWYRGYVSLWRALTCLDSRTKHRPSALEVLSLANAPIPALKCYSVIGRLLPSGLGWDSLLKT